MSGEWEMAISKWSQVSCQGIALLTLLSGAESQTRSVTITVGKQISGILVLVPVGSLMCSMQPLLHYYICSVLSGMLGSY